MLNYRLMTASYALESVQSGLLKVGDIVKLNDPSDCAPIITGLPERYDDFPDLAIRHIFSQVADAVGVLCYTNAIIDPVVWSHYGDSHKGIALGFDIPPSRYAREIQYLEARPSISVYDMDDRPAMGLMDSDVLFRKSPSWIYEKEVRQVFLLDECIPSRGMYFYRYPPESLKEIVIGDRCEVNIRYISNLLKSIKRDDVAVKRAINQQGSFSINIQ